MHFVRYSISFCILAVHFDLIMKKLYTTKKYKSRHNRLCRLLQRRSRPKRRKYIVIVNVDRQKDKMGLVIDAPENCSFVESTNDCACFFNKLRLSESLWIVNRRKFLYVSLSNVKNIDFHAIVTFLSIIDEMKSRGINTRGELPKDLNCRRFLVDSGFLSKMYDENGKKFQNTSKSELMYFEKGEGKLTVSQMEMISNCVEHTCKYLTGGLSSNTSLKSMLKEICGNSIEWSNSHNKKWQLGIMYGNNEVVFTAVDLGKGILDTIYRKHSQLIKEFFFNDDRLTILKNAFNKKYGSNTQEENRGKGLPGIKNCCDDGYIQELLVITNNVRLDFVNPNKSLIFATEKNLFKGTMYRWVLRKECFFNSIDN